MEPTLRPPFAHPSVDDPYLKALAQRVLVFDGATGTNLQLQPLTADDFGGAALEGCNEALNVTKPATVEALHRSFFDVGVDAVETNSFGSFSVILAEYGIAQRAHELALASAQIARRVADSYASANEPKFVAGSMGPGTKFPTLGQITYDDLSASYEELALGLLEGGVDLLLVETMFDLLSGKAAIAACHRAMARHGRVVPIQVQVTIELTGRMLPGTEIGAAITALTPLGIDVIGLNCATGPVEMYEPLRTLSDSAPLAVSCMPNAGLPSVVDGKMHYDLTPDALAEHLARFVSEYGVQVVGGCCGTTPEHLARVIETAPERRQALARRRICGGVDLLTRQLSTGPFSTARGRKNQRERLKKVPRRHARGRLGHLCRDRARADKRGRAHFGRLRGLHRRRRGQ
jgi:5-methyltetrahydrofolate--homocysteine methyltransferase